MHSSGVASPASRDGGEPPAATERMKQEEEASGGRISKPASSMALADAMEEQDFYSDDIDEDDLFGSDDMPTQAEFSVDEERRQLENAVLNTRNSSHLDAAPASGENTRHDIATADDLNENEIAELEHELEFSSDVENQEDLDADFDSAIDHECYGFPQIPAHRKSFLVDVPHFIHLEARPYDPCLYIGESEDDYTDPSKAARPASVRGDETPRGLNPELRLRVENTIRWRLPEESTSEDEKNNLEGACKSASIPLSNASIVTWSDGQMSLLVGDELFDAVPAVLPPGQSAFAIDPDDNVLTFSAPLKEKLMLQPSRVNDSRTHALIAQKLGTKFGPRRGTKLIAIDRNTTVQREEPKQSASSKSASKRSHQESPGNSDSSYDDATILTRNPKKKSRKIKKTKSAGIEFSEDDDSDNDSDADDDDDDEDDDFYDEDAGGRKYSGAEKGREKEESRDMEDFLVDDDEIEDVFVTDDDEEDEDAFFGDGGEYKRSDKRSANPKQQRPEKHGHSDRRAR